MKKIFLVITIILVITTMTACIARYPQIKEDINFELRNDDLNIVIEFADCYGRGTIIYEETEYYFFVDLFTPSEDIIFYYINNLNSSLTCKIYFSFETISRSFLGIHNLSEGIKLSFSQNDTELDFMKNFSGVILYYKPLEKNLNKLVCWTNEWRNANKNILFGINSIKDMYYNQMTGYFIIPNNLIMVTFFDETFIIEDFITHEILGKGFFELQHEFSEPDLFNRRSITRKLLMTITESDIYELDMVILEAGEFRNIQW